MLPTSDARPLPLQFAPRETRVQQQTDGSLILRSPISFKMPDWSILDFLPAWAEQAPERVFLAQRTVAGPWQTVSYAQMWRQVCAVAQGLVGLGAKAGDYLVILSGNSIEHAVINFAAMSLGVVVAPVSPNYTLMPGGLTRLREIADLLRPTLVFAQSGKDYAAARTLPSLAKATWITADTGSSANSPSSADSPSSSGLAHRALRIQDLYDQTVTPAVGEAWRTIDKTVAAKILFTSGSTGQPKGVINTHRMMACSLEMGALMAPTAPAPVQVEWLPWHHTMGSNVILHGILKNGGTLYIDDGRPMPVLFGKTIANLREIAPTAMFNVPGGYVLLCEALEVDAALRANFFKQLTRLTYAGAAISRTTLDSLYRLSMLATGRRIPVMAGYGTTETAPSISSTHWATEQPGEIGLPAPGLEMKLIPTADSYEVRVRGPNVTPGYLGQPELTAAAFDADGFYRVGDTVDFLDASKPQLGLRFTGRLSENFKLANGTWVVVGSLRAALVNAAKGVLQDVVIAGENQTACAVLGWINPVLAKPHISDPSVEIHRDAGVLAFLRDCLHAHNQVSGSSEKIRAFLLLTEPPSFSAGEITDKAYVNQRAVLKHRHASVALLYRTTPNDSVIVV